MEFSDCRHCGYLRLFPYSILKYGLRHLNQHQHPGIIYMHPGSLWCRATRIPNLPPLTKIRHYINLHTTATKQTVARFWICLLPQRITTVMRPNAKGVYGHAANAFGVLWIWEIQAQDSVFVCNISINSPSVIILMLSSRSLSSSAFRSFCRACQYSSATANPLRRRLNSPTLSSRCLESNRRAATLFLGMFAGHGGHFSGKRKTFSWNHNKFLQLMSTSLLLWWTRTASVLIYIMLSQIICQAKNSGNFVTIYWQDCAFTSDITFHEEA